MSADEMIACLGSCRARWETAAMIKALSLHPWLRQSHARQQWFTCFRLKPAIDRTEKLTLFRPLDDPAA